MGYSLAYCFEISFCYFCTDTAGLCMKFLNGSRLIVTAFTKDIKQELRSLNERQKINRYRPHEIQLKLSNMIQFDSKARQLSNKFNVFVKQIENVQLQIIFLHFSRFTVFCNLSRLANDVLDIYHFILTAYFGWSLLSICTTLLVFQSGIVEYLIPLILIFFYKYSCHIF